MKNFGRFSGKAFLLLQNAITFLPLATSWFLLQGCSASHSKSMSPESAVTEAITAVQNELIQSMIADTSLHFIPDDEPTEVENEPRETRLKYPAFSVVFHNFKGYEVHENDRGTRNYYSQFGGESEITEAVLNDSERELEDYIEALIVKKDTLHISEQLFDDRINNTLIQIIPKNKTDRFKLSFCYLASLNQVIDYRNYSPEEYDSLLHDVFRTNEKTKYFPIKDSAAFYFRAMPHTADMEEVTVKDGKIVPVKKPNTEAQINWEMQQIQEELARIKAKYQLRDTLVVIPGEYDKVATLTKNKELFSYGYDAFLFRLQRFNNKHLLETKYIVVSIAYGC